MKTIFDVVNEYKGKTIRYWQYKKPGLKYYSDSEEPDSPFVTEMCAYSEIMDAYTLPDGDVLLVLSDNDGAYREFYKLSELEIAFTEKDNE